MVIYVEMFTLARKCVLVCILVLLLHTVATVLNYFYSAKQFMVAGASNVLHSVSQVRSDEGIEPARSLLGGADQQDE